MQIKIHKYLSWIPAIAIAAAIFIFSSQNADESTVSSNFVLRFLLEAAAGLHLIRPDDSSLGQITQLLGTLVRKCAHMTEFSALYLSLLYALYHWNWRGTRWLRFALFLTVLYACTDEFHQRFVPGRYGCLTDVLIDSIGAALITVLLHIFLIRKRKKLANG
jgi:VanZ family protein